MAVKKTKRKNPNIPPTSDSPRKIDKYILFLQWSALPYPDKKVAGIDTQKDFSLKYKVDEDTLTKWKKRKDFDPMVFSETQKWARERWSNVMGGLYSRSLKGYALEVELYMAFAFGWTRDEAKEQAIKPPVHEEDIFELAKYLPQEKKKDLYVKIAELIADARIARDETNGA